MIHFQIIVPQKRRDLVGFALPGISAMQSINQPLIYFNPAFKIHSGTGLVSIAVSMYQMSNLQNSCPET
jgi:hypothetical protein